MRKSHSVAGVVLVLFSLSGCNSDSPRISYLCDEPLEPYSQRAKEHISNDYEVERNRNVLERCPEKGFHRRYRFSFDRAALVTRQSASALVEAQWCSDDDTRHVKAELESSASLLVFQFQYPWSTATGKYPRTEFRLDRQTLKGGFFDDLNWDCALDNESN